MIHVTNADLLKQALEAVQASRWAAVDTEADSLHHYIEKLCLLQVSTADEDFVLDPLGSLDLKPLVDLLATKELYFHGADFDIRILKKTYGFKPREVFDTMIAAQLLGYEKQSLADLVSRHCGVVLSKANQKADWSKRPLSEDLLTYAANDTHYLWVLKEKMTKELTELGRLGWQEENCRRLVETLLAMEEKSSDPETDWQIQGANVLKGRALTILKRLWQWREEEARRLDRPTFKVLHSKILIEIAQWAAQHPGEDIAKLPDAPRNIRGVLRETLNRLIEDSKRLPQAQLVRLASRRPRRRLDETMTAKVEAMKKVRDAVALGLKIHPSLLSTNAELETLIWHAPKNLEAFCSMHCLSRWQEGLLAKSYLEIINR